MHKMSASSSNQVEQITGTEKLNRQKKKPFSYSVQIYPGMNFESSTTSNTNDNISNVVHLTDLIVTQVDPNRTQMQIEIQQLDEYKALEEKMEKKMVLIISLISIMGIVALAIGLIVSQK